MNDPIINIGDIVALKKDAWDILPKLTKEESVAALSKLKVLDAEPMVVDQYPNMKDLTLEGLDKYMIPSSYVYKVQ